MKLSIKEKLHLQKKDWFLIALILFVAGLAFFCTNLSGERERAA